MTCTTIALFMGGVLTCNPTVSRIHERCEYTLHYNKEKFKCAEVIEDFNDDLFPEDLAIYVKKPIWHLGEIILEDGFHLFDNVEKDETKK